MGLEKEKESAKEQLKQRRRENALKRSQLGFKDKEPEVEDKVLEELEWNSKQYLQQIQEQKERKPVKLVTDVRGISKEEINSLKLTDEEKFRPI